MAEQSWDVVVVGSGAAGLMACLELPQHLRVLLLSKDQDPPGDARTNPRSASRWAQGGIAAVTRPNDSFTSHVIDTLRAGAGLCGRPWSGWCMRPRCAWSACSSWAWPLTGMVTV
jgi:L-aspartate oxidase